MHILILYSIFFSHLGFVFYFIFLQQITVILLYCKKKNIRPNILKSVYLEREETISFFVFDTDTELLKADMDMILLKADVDADTILLKGDTDTILLNANIDTTQYYKADTDTILLSTDIDTTQYF